jgi:hypothetical protein
VVSYGTSIYRFKVNHAPGAWNSNHVDKTTAEAVTNKKLESYSTTTQTSAMIENYVGGYVDGELSNYSTTEQTSTMISDYVGTYVDGELADYSTTTQTSKMIRDYVGTYVAGELADYSTTDQTSTMIANYVGTYVDGELASYSTTQQTATQISSYVTNNAYTLKSGISISASGIDVNGSLYVHIRANNNSYVYLDPGIVDIKGSSTSQVIINSTGITMAGNSISINGRVFDNTNLFARDDIRILKKTDNEQTVINSMSGKHDWVLIKPFYNAEIRCAYDGYYRSTSGQYNTNVVNMSQDGSGSAGSFGNGASWYRYVLTGTLERQSGESSSSGCEFIARLSNYASLSGGVATTKNIDTTPTAISFTIDSGNVNVNLCTEGALIYLRLDTQYSYERISNLRLTCTCDSTTSRVPCTVYYFP